MPRLLISCLGMLSVLIVAPVARQASGRAVTPEDYYLVQAVGSTSFSPSSEWVTYTVTTRLEEPATNSSHVETWIVRADGTGARRIQLDGRDVASPSWSADGRLEFSVDNARWSVDPGQPSAAPAPVATPESSGRGSRGGGRGGPPAVLAPDGKVEAALVNKPLPAKAPSAASEFEKRHQQRFKGVTFDWKDFQRDGAEFPAPDPTAQPAQQIALRPRGEAAAANVIADLDLRPAGLTWHPDGRRLAFTADPDWRDALKYNSSDLWTVTIDGEVTRLTNDDYVYASPDYSPDGRYLAYERSFGTDMIIRERLNHGGRRTCTLFRSPAARQST